mmetsp:Transcript_45515/g.106394  ORF Transcript_45515/g.106394 Transcript_45515/m.106394 type:complete len:328 (-) Transcript_45515:302-1285(-)
MMSDFANFLDVTSNSWDGEDEKTGAFAGYLEPMKVPLPSLSPCAEEFGVEPPPGLGGQASRVFIPMQQCPETGRVLRFQDPTGTPVQSFDGGETPGSVVNRVGSRVAFPPGLDPPPNTPSHGSTLHADGQCKPCAWYWKPGSCQNGKECMHCHLCPKDELKTRKKAKSAFMRLGLTTPKPSPEELAEEHFALSSFCLSPKNHKAVKTVPTDFETSEQGSTAATTSEREYSDGSGSPRQSPGGDASEMITKLPSQGSQLHGSGECRPCAWFWKPSGCLNGAECRHCHICPPGEVKNRKKGKLAMLRLGLATPKAAGRQDFFSMDLPTA